ncbi:MAG: hypothetical protein KDA41_14345 [Planctomycetales bacterium]|nr:hypothetical protein [Planctomycetales bacterium]
MLQANAAADASRRKQRWTETTINRLIGMAPCVGQPLISAGEYKPGRQPRGTKSVPSSSFLTALSRRTIVMLANEHWSSFKASCCDSKARPALQSDIDPSAPADTPFCYNTRLKTCGKCRALSKATGAEVDRPLLLDRDVGSALLMAGLVLRRLLKGDRLPHLSVRAMDDDANAQVQ